jgi:S1-C subfamily serine protease
MLGDIIVRIQERQIGELSDLQEVLRGLRSGDTAKLAIVRGGEARESNVTVGERPRRT